MDTSIINPFKNIVFGLNTESWTKVSLDYLEQTHKLLKAAGVPLETYGDVFKVLEFLYEHGAIDLKQEEDYHFIKGINFGKNNL